MKRAHAPLAGEAWLDLETTAQRLRRQRVLLVSSANRRWLWVKSVLDETPGVEVVGEVASGTEAIDAMEALRPHVALLAGELSVEMSRGVIRELRRAGPTTRIIVIGEDAGQEALLDAGKGSVGGYLSWDVLDEGKLRAGFIAAAAGLKFSTVDAADEEGTLPDRRRRPRDEGIVLTHREREVLRAIAAGRENGQIARQLAVSGRTVRRIITELERKLGVTNRAALAARAVELGLGPSSMAEVGHD